MTAPPSLYTAGVTEEDTAVVQYVEALRELWGRDGQPSSRTIAERARNAGGRPLSHSTVNDLVRRGKRIASWPVNELLIRALNGDPDELHPLWAAAYNEANPIEYATPTQAPPTRMDELINEVRAVRKLLERLVDQG